jgi:hypothetical protein
MYLRVKFSTCLWDNQLLKLTNFSDWSVLNWMSGATEGIIHHLITNKNNFGNRMGYVN